MSPWDCEARVKIGLNDYTTTKTAFSYFLNTIAEVANFIKDPEVNREISEDVLKQWAFSLIIKEGIFSIGAVQSEPEYFFGTRLHCSYFDYFSLDETAHLIHCLIAAKCTAKVAHCTRLNFETSDEPSVIYNMVLRDHSRETELRIDEHLEVEQAKSKLPGLDFIVSEKPAMLEGSSPLAIYRAFAHPMCQHAGESRNERDMQMISSAEFRGILVALALGHLILYPLRLAYHAGTEAKKSDVLVHVVLCAFSALGNFVSPFFFAVHVLECFSTQDSRMLLAAATMNLGKLGQEPLVIVAMVYVWAAVGFRLFQDKHADGKCATYLNCFISYLDGELAGSGIHEALEFDMLTSLFEVSQLLDFFFQMFCMVFLIIYVQVLLAIFSGIIIDSFGEIRDKHEEVTSHLHETRHILSNPSHWQYVCVLIFVHQSEDASPEALTDLEAFVVQMVQAADAAWLPYKMELSTEEGAEYDEDKKAAQIAEIRS